MKQKRSAWMRTRAKRNHAAGDRARRENVPRHILYSFTGVYVLLVGGNHLFMEMLTVNAESSYKKHRRGFYD